VLALLDLLQSVGAAVWVDGGWGVDALIGHQSRPHADLDLSVDTPSLAAVRSVLADEGFVVLRDDLPTALALRHPDGREVDLHPVVPTDDGGGDQALPDGGWWHYPPPATGRIDGREVICLSVETQVRAHASYEPDDGDRADMALLADAFGVELPQQLRTRPPTL